MINNFSSYSHEVFEELPELVVGCNFESCEFKVTSKFERCNLRHCTFDVACTFDRSNVNVCKGDGLDTSTFIKSGRQDEEDEKRRTHKEEMEEEIREE